MRIHSLTKCSLADYPGMVCATIFLTGCNFRCTYCHNTPMLDAPAKDCIPEEEVLSYLEKRKGLLDSVCITGGEPTLAGDLAFYLKEIKKLGLSIKLDTNGSRPEVLQELTSAGLIDYIAMDIKTTPDLYPALCRPSAAERDLLTAINRSADWLLDQREIPYEFRTTLIRGHHTDEVLRRIGEWLWGADRYVLQNFCPAPGVPDQTLRGLLPQEMEALKQLLSPYFTHIELRVN